MTSTEDIQPGLPLTGLEPGMIVSVMAAVPIGAGAVQLICKLPDRVIRQRPVAVDGGFVETMIRDYPRIALRERLLNAVINGNGPAQYMFDAHQDHRRPRALMKIWTLCVLSRQIPFWHSILS